MLVPALVLVLIQQATLKRLRKVILTGWHAALRRSHIWTCIHGYIPSFCTPVTEQAEPVSILWSLPYLALLKLLHAKRTIDFWRVPHGLRFAKTKEIGEALIEQELMQMPENRRSMVKGLLERVKNHEHDVRLWSAPGTILPRVSMQGLGMRKSWEKDVLLTPLKAGEERYSEPLILCENERFALFVQCDQIDEQMKDWGWKVLDCVRRYFDENSQPSWQRHIGTGSFRLVKRRANTKALCKSWWGPKEILEQKSFSGHYRILQLLLQQLPLLWHTSTEQACTQIPDDPQEIVDRAQIISAQGIKTVVLQSGEDPFYTKRRSVTS